MNSEDPGGPDFPGFPFLDFGFLDSWTSQGVQIFQDFHSWILDSWISVSRLNFPLPTLIGFALEGQTTKKPVRFFDKSKNPRMPEPDFRQIQESKNLIFDIVKNQESKNQESKNLTPQNSPNQPTPFPIFCFIPPSQPY